MSSHVIPFDTIPADVRGAYEILAAAGALSVRASTCGYWCLKLRPGTNAVTLEGLLRGAGCPAFAGSPTLLTLRAITTEEIELFEPDDQRVLRTVRPSDQGSVIERIIKSLSDAG